MKILLVYPEYPDTFWGFKHALRFISKKTAYPPLGLLTVAAMLPRKWNKKLIDMNVSAIKDKDIRWADYVFISAMIAQKESAKEIIARCNKHGIKVIAGGPVFTTGHEEFKGVDCFVLGEAEITLSQFLKDLEKNCAKRLYLSNERPDITKTPVPLWELININNYASLSIQYSRGCPYDCEFCDIVIMNGRIPRTKNPEQILAELEAVYQTGFRGSLFIVDDNFIGNKAKVKRLLPQITQWQKSRHYPFWLLTEASLNIAEDEKLMQMMVEAGFGKVFIGLETPHQESLIECGKIRNKNHDMTALVKKVQNHGLQVMGGYILGFDSDPPTIFKDQINFIQKTGVVIAMLGILDALPETRLYKRLKQEGRLLKESTGNNTDGSLNFVPKMNPEILKAGYLYVIQTLYSPKKYYERIINFFKEYKPLRKRMRISASEVRAFLRSIWRIGIKNNCQERWYYWKLLMVSALKYPHFLSEAVVLQIYGFHFRKIINKLKT